VAPWPLLATRGYCSVADIRADGVTEDDGSDFALYQGIVLASPYIERVTRRWFYPAMKAFSLSSQGGPVLGVPAPIVGVSAVTEAYDGNFANGSVLDPASYLPFARHLSEGLVLEEDDRSNPRIQRLFYWDRPYISAPPGCWPTGDRIIQVVGAFGYTEPDGATGGRTPDLIRLACIKLAQKFARKGGSSSSSSAAASAAVPTGGIIREKTTDQEVEYAQPGVPKAISGGISGDADIDQILVSFRAPLRARGI
jgi:hypothetical protein